MTIPFLLASIASPPPSDVKRWGQKPTTEQLATGLTQTASEGKEIPPQPQSFKSWDVRKAS